jgi:hypothetical protein
VVALRSVCVEVAKDGEHTAVLVGVRRQVEFGEDGRDDLFDAANAEYKTPGNRLVGASLSE